MAKFHELTFYNKKEGKFKIFSYTIAVPKVLVEEAGLENTEIELKLSNDKIIIQKAVDKR